MTVDGLTRYQTMEGFGSSERVFDDPHVFDDFNPATGRALTTMTRAQQDEVLDRLYRELRLTRVRAASPDGGGLEPVNDNADPGLLDPTKFDFSWKKLDAHCDYFARARDRGATTFYLSPLTRETWMNITTQGDAAEYAEWLFAQVQRCAALGVRLPYLAVANEPSWVRPMIGAGFIRDVITTLGPMLRAAGLPTRFVLPDDVNPSATAAIAEVVLADPAARPYVGAVATHLYLESLSQVAKARQVADRYGLPLWMTEFYEGVLPQVGLPAGAFGWATMMHSLIATYGVSTIDYLWGYFGSWDRDTMLLSLNDRNSVYTGYTLRKSYYVTGQFSRFIPPGAVRVKAEPSESPARVTAYTHDGNLTIVAVNESNSSEPLTFELKGFSGGERAVPVRTGDVENWAELAPIPVRDASFAALLAPRSVTTFVLTQGTGTTTPPPSGSGPPGGPGLLGEPRPTLPPTPPPLASSPLGSGADTAPPTVSALRLSTRRFRASRGRARAKRYPVGTTVSFRLSEPAAVSLRFERLRPGLQLGRRCVAPVRSPPRGRRRCVRSEGVAGSVDLGGRTGINRLRFSGRPTGRGALAPGRYRLTVVAVDAAGNRSVPVGGGFALL